jgi:uncharacterized protein
VTDWVGVWLYRHHFSKRNLLILTPALLLGIAIATLVTPYTPEAVLLIVTGAIGLWHCLRTWLRRGDIASTEARVLPGIFWGVLTGITSFITHSGSPPAQAYLMPQRLPRLEFAGTIAICFAIGNLVKLPAYWSIGQLDGLDWPLIAGLAVTGILGTLIGRYVTKRLSETAYRRIIMLLLFALSLILLFRGTLELQHLLPQG